MDYSLPTAESIYYWIQGTRRFGADIRTESEYRGHTARADEDAPQAQDCVRRPREKEADNSQNTSLEREHSSVKWSRWNVFSLFAFIN